MMESRRNDTPANPYILRYGVAAMVLATALMAPGIEFFLGPDRRFQAFGAALAWERWIVALHLISDLLIGISYVAISTTLIVLARRARQDIPFLWTFVAFGVFIIACGFTHFMGAITLWWPVYWAAAAIKILTAIASVATAVAIPPLVPRVLTLIQHVKEQRVVREQLEESQARFVAAFEGAAIGMALVDAEGRWLHINESLCHITGYTAAELRDMRFQDITYPEDLDDNVEHMELVASGEQPSYATFKRYVRKDGALIWVHLTSAPVRDATGAFRYFVTQVEDVTERRRAEDEVRTLLAERSATLEVVEHHALHDSLTDLPNRRLLGDRLEQVLRQSRRNKSPFALLLLDLDRFKHVNDTLGHHVGDDLLQALGAKLSSALRESDTVARLGGDEFAVLLPGANAAGASEVARSLVSKVEAPIMVGPHRLNVSTSIGVALYPDHGDTAEHLMQRADVAMYIAKRGGTGVAMYSASDDPNSRSRLVLTSELREAVERNYLVLHYQPKLDAVSGALLGCEALVRWQHPTRGIIPPGEFVPLAEQAGFMRLLTEWVLRTATLQARQWEETGLRMPIAVNLSAVSLQDEAVLTSIDAALLRSRMDPDLLTVEITETAVVKSPETARAVVTQLRERGVHVSIDDFGVGYSSLSHLATLPAHELKIDRSFIQGIDRDRRKAIVVRSITDVGHAMGMWVVAEGVEDPETLESLRGIGCDVLQGFLFATPMPAPEFLAWARSYVPVATYLPPCISAAGEA